VLKEGARLVTSPEEVLEELQDLFIGKSARVASALRTPARPAAPREPQKPVPVMTAEERSLLALATDVGTHVDTLIRETGLPAGRVNALLVSMQIKRLVRLMPGGLVKRLSSETAG
jgi:predicted Rossmann fold nucleotide-binding protein DprA/Smf involved in DNA uptake